MFQLIENFTHPSSISVGDDRKSGDFRLEVEEMIRASRQAGGMVKI